MKAQVLFDPHGHVISMLLPATGARHGPNAASRRFPAREGTAFGGA